MLGKKRSLKVKKIVRRYNLRLNDYEQNVFIGYVVKTILEIKNKIANTDDPIELEKLINEKYAFMKITIQLGIYTYLHELENRKSIQREIESILEERYTPLNENDEPVVIEKSVKTDKEIIPEV